jgi:hypothetical protein
MSKTYEKPDHATTGTKAETKAEHAEHAKAEKGKHGKDAPETVEPYDPAAPAIETMKVNAAVAEAEAKALAEFEAGRPDREKAVRESQEGAAPR